MVNISEAVGQQTPLNGALTQSLKTLSRDQKVIFTKYTKFVLPADGYVFWVASNLRVTVAGSLHYGINKEQREDETIAVNRVIFTSEQKIQHFDAIDPNTIFIGKHEGLKFAFSRQGDFYQQTELWHYIGDAVYPALESQLVESEAALSALEPIVTNSLPIWLGQNQFGTVYPSFLVPDNVQPPYIVAHIEPDGTEALQAFPLFNMNITGTSAAIGFFQIGASAIGESELNYGTPVPGQTGMFYQPSSQLMRDHVRLTLYGFTNQTAIQFFVSLMQYSMNTDDFGFMNSPAIKDDKRTQVEMSMIAQKKHIDIVASYYQGTANAIAQRLILEASCSFTIV